MMFCKELCSDEIHLDDVVLQTCHKGSIVFMPVGHPLCNGGSVGPEEVYCLVSKFICSVIPYFVFRGDFALLDHVVSCMALDLGEPDGCWTFGLGMEPICMP